MRILFLCVANSARSQMAEGLAKSIFGDKHLIQSAGSKPSKVNPLAIKVLSEEGIDIKNQYSKFVDDIDPETVDIVITLCAEEVCPIFLGKTTKYHWALTDPANPNLSEEEELKLFRQIRDEIKKRLINLNDTLRS